MAAKLAGRLVLLLCQHNGHTGQGIPMSENTKQPDILVDTFGKDAPAAAKAGQGARTLDEIKQATEARTRPGQYNNSNSDNR
jgi:hypothetical protein